MDFTNGLEIMAVPNKETLIYINDIYSSWVQKEELDDKKEIVVTFKKNVSKRIIDKFIKIKDNIGVPFYMYKFSDHYMIES
ncbi:hypothetical protein AALT52_06435 [Ligilactobacillus faecis]|uniref:Uncharacterized protein n=1 Tax=Ligilactobacillus faecis TaxID=762833 RepID=A0ABV4DRZ1_9LACO